MPPTLKVSKKKGKGGKGRKRKKGKKKGKLPTEIHPPPLHLLTKIYWKLEDQVDEVKKIQNVARKKQLESWFMTREILDIKHDNAVYRQHLEEKLENVKRSIKELEELIQKEKDAIDKLVKERLAEYEKRGEAHRARLAQLEKELNEVREQLQEFEPQMAKLAKLLARLREVDRELAIAERKADLKMRHLKNQYLDERAKLHNHMDLELYKLVTTCKSHLLPILSNHMRTLADENVCNRWQLNLLDHENFTLIQKRDDLMEERTRLMTEEPYLTAEWAFQKLNESTEKKRLARWEAKHKKSIVEKVEECELSKAFDKYLKLKLERYKQDKLEADRAAKLAEKEHKRREEEHAARKAKRMETEEEEEEGIDYSEIYLKLLDQYGDDWEEMVDEYEGDIPLEKLAAARKKLIREARRAAGGSDDSSSDGGSDHGEDTHEDDDHDDHSDDDHSDDDEEEDDAGPARSSSSLSSEASSASSGDEIVQELLGGMDDDGGKDDDD